jgi:hypothetical protein
LGRVEASTGEESQVKQLYKVDLSATIYVYADGCQEAAQIAESNLNNDENELESNAKVANPIDVTSDEWGGCIPYGEGVDDRTCNELLDENNKTACDTA